MLHCNKNSDIRKAAHAGGLHEGYLGVKGAQNHAHKGLDAGADEHTVGDLGHHDGVTHAVRVRLFKEWGISFEKPYTVPEKANRKVAYANRDELVQSIELYTQRIAVSDLEGADIKASGGMELTQGMVSEKVEKKSSHKSLYNTGEVR